MAGWWMQQVLPQGVRVVPGEVVWSSRSLLPRSMVNDSLIPNPGTEPPGDWRRGR
jgi:hypothetical protein